MCRNLAVASGFSLACAGSIKANEAILATAADSTTYVAGAIETKLLISGHGAWLTAFDAKQLAAKHTSGYVMVGRQAIKPKKQPDLTKLVRQTVLDDEEWRALSREDRVGEKASDYIGVDSSAALGVIVKGGSLLR